jgi:hypothetical protein
MQKSQNKKLAIHAVGGQTVGSRKKLREQRPGGEPGSRKKNSRAEA